MSNVISFNARAAKPKPEQPVAALRADIAETWAVLNRFAFAHEDDRATFTAPDYEGFGMAALARRTRDTETGGERQGYMAMAAAAYVASQRLHKASFWLDDAERWIANKDPALTHRLADENFIIYAEQALLRNAKLHPDCVQYALRAMAASAAVVHKARGLQASLGLNHSGPAAPAP